MKLKLVILNILIISSSWISAETIVCPSTMSLYAKVVEVGSNNLTQFEIVSAKSIAGWRYDVGEMMMIVGHPDGYVVHGSDIYTSEFSKGLLVKGQSQFIQAKLENSLLFFEGGKNLLMCFYRHGEENVYEGYYQGVYSRELSAEFTCEDSDVGERSFECLKAQKNYRLQPKTITVK
jgi:hypothetical protein